MLACCFVHRQRARQPDETATRIVVEVSAAIFRFGSSLPRDVCNRLYVLDAPRSPCRILYQGHVSGWLRSCLCLEDDGSVCRDPTCHLARPKPSDPVELRSLMHRIHHISPLNNLAGLSAYRFVGPGRCSAWFVGLLSKHSRRWQRTASAPFLGSAESQ